MFAMEENDDEDVYDGGRRGTRTASRHFRPRATTFVDDDNDDDNDRRNNDVLLVNDDDDDDDDERIVELRGDLNIVDMGGCVVPVLASPPAAAGPEDLLN
jgi:hypothetical protein